MNNICKVVWSHVHQQFVVVSEIASSLGKAKSIRDVAIPERAGVCAIEMKIRTLCMAVACAALAPTAWAQVVAALPVGGQVVAGQGSIQAQGSVMTVNQASQRMAIDWQSFNVGTGQTVNFVQPNAQATALNRVLGSDVSTIQGQIHANGRVYLLNPNGILFTPSAQVNVGGLVASTLDMSNVDFMAGNDRLAGDSTGAVINQGQIRASQGGTVALLAARVTNVGEISAPSGSALLAAGRKVRLDLGGPAQIEIEEGVLNALIEQSGSIRAADGMVYLTAKATSQLSGSAINQNGLIEAGSIDAKGGLVVLEADHIRLGSGSRIDATGAKGGGTVLVGGDWQGSGNLRQATTVTMASGSVIDASATDNGNGGKVVLWSDVRNASSVTTASGALYAKGGALGGDGGQIETSGAKLITDGVTGSAAAPKGMAGDWLFDPYDIEIVASSGDTNGSFSSGTWSASGDSSKILSSTIETLLNGATNVIINTAGAGTQAGNILVSSAITPNAGSASLSLVADGTVTLNNAIAVRGDVSITTTGLSGTGGVALLFGKTLTVNQSGASNYGGVVSGTNANLVKDGAGALTLSADHTYTGSTTISGGTLQVGNGGSTGSLATSNVVNNSNLVFYTGSDKAIPYAISGTGSVEVKGGEYSIFNNYLTTSNQTIATGKTVLDVLERIAGGQQGGTYINCQTSGGTTTCSTIPAGAYNKKYDAATDTATFQIQSYFDGGANNQYTKVVFVKLSALGSDVAVSSYGGRSIAGVDRNAVYKAGNHLGTDFSDPSVSGVNGFDLATAINGNGYGVAELYASAKIQFTAANTYTGQTTISNTVQTATAALLGGATSTYSRVTSGILELGSGGSVGSIADTLSVQNNGVLIFNRSDAVAFDKNISGIGNVVKNNTNTVTYTGAGTYSGITYVNGGTLSVGSGATAGSLTSNINNKANVTFDRSDDLTYAGIVSGTGTLTKTGAGNLTMTGNQTYTGATTISAGQLVLSNNAPTKGTSSFAGPGQLVIQPAGDDFAADFSTSGWTFDSTLGGLTIGKSTSANGSGDKNVTVANAISIAGPVTIYAKDTAIDGGLTSTAANGTITLKGSGNVSDGANGFVVADNLLLLGGNVQLDHASNNVTKLAASVVGNLTYRDSNGLTIGTVGSTDGITATGAVDVQTLTGDLTVAKSVNTTNATSSALLLNAGQSATPGTTSGGNLIITGSSTVGVGSGGTAKLYSGSVSGSTGLTTLVGSGSARFRYNSDETTSNYTTGLSTGLNVIYREQPSANFSGGGPYSMAYGDALPTGSATGLVNGDVATIDAIGRQNSTSGNIKVGSYSVTSGLLGLGYSVTGSTSGTLTVTPKTISNISDITAANKTYDGGTSASLTTSSANYAGKINNDVLTVASGAGTFDARDVGNGKTVSIAGLSLGGADAANYTLASSTASTTANITKKDVILVGITASNKAYDGNSAASITAGSISGTVGSETLSLSGTGGFDTPNAGQGKTVTVADVSTLTKVNGTGNWGNYNLITTGSKTTTADISKKPLSLAINAQYKRNGDPDPAWSYQILSGALLNGDAPTFSRVAGEAPGKYLISAANPNYQISAADAYLTVGNRIDSPSLVNGLLTVAPVQPAAQATSSPALAAPSTTASQLAPTVGADASAQVSSGLMMIPVAADQAKGFESAVAPSSDKASGGAGPAAAGLLQSAQAQGYTGVLVVEGGVRLPDGVR